MVDLEPLGSPAPGHDAPLVSKEEGFLDPSRHGSGRGGHRPDVDTIGDEQREESLAQQLAGHPHRHRSNTGDLADLVAGNGATLKGGSVHADQHLGAGAGGTTPSPGTLRAHGTAGAPGTLRAPGTAGAPGTVARPHMARR